MIKLYKNNGFLGFYKGFNSTILTRSGTFAYFGGQEYANVYLKSKHPERGLNNFEQFMTGGFAGTCYWLSIYPLDVIKNRMMSQPDIIPKKYPTILSCIKHIYQVDGIKGYFRGFVPCALRTFPANGTTFLALKLLLDFLHRFDDNFK